MHGNRGLDLGVGPRGWWRLSVGFYDPVGCGRAGKSKSGQQLRRQIVSVLRRVLFSGLSASVAVAYSLMGVRAMHADDELMQAVLCALVEARIADTEEGYRSRTQGPGSGARQEYATLFHAATPPPISPVEYMHRVFKYAFCSSSCFIAALAYLERIRRHNASLRLSNTNFHRLWITSVMLAAKFFDDVYYENTYYSRVGGISLDEMNALELEFLRTLNFELFIQPEEFSQFENELIGETLERRALCCVPAREMLARKGFHSHVKAQRMLNGMNGAHAPQALVPASAGAQPQAQPQNVAWMLPS
ncbi:Cyclin-U4-1 [Porphyridium purpureum]|uniref:Cyclin-U4-1 n=1 Tax=Porphyridium purpureum TaxID=35688 RepID=A0A5J4YNB6_PORPP|nr:Cyclin-U4-1 [Porphyridium purpureum]|eukprot:POR3545..scf222_8